MDIVMTKLIYCGAGNKRFAKIAIECGLEYGARLPNKIYHAPYFADQDWQNPNRQRYMAAVRQYRPALATVLDLEDETQLTEVMSWAEEVAAYVTEAVIIIPKIPVIDKLPHTIQGRQVRLGYPVPIKTESKFAGRPLPIWAYGRRPVHLLGGSPQAQLTLAHSLNVQSIDNNYIMNRAIKGMFFSGGSARYAKNRYFPLGNESVFGDVLIDMPYFMFRLSCINLVAAWSGCKATIRYGVEADIPHIKRLSKQYRSELGWVRTTSLNRGINQRTLYVAEYGRRIVGFCLWHKRRDNISTVYDIAVDRAYTRAGIGRALINAIPGAVRVKCIVHNKANAFYERIGFVMEGQDSGRRNPLNVWIRPKVQNHANET